MQWPECTQLGSVARRYLYGAIPKVACSSLKRWMIEFETRSALPPGYDVHRTAMKKFTLGALPSHESAALLHEPDVFRFAFVRNPWARLTSAYLNKFIPCRAPALGVFDETLGRSSLARWCDETAARIERFIRRRRSPILPAPRHQRLAEQFTFARFVDYLEKANLRTCDSHWRPQSFFLGQTKWNFIGRFENLSRDFDFVRNRLGSNVALPSENETRYRGVEVPQGSLAHAPLSALRTETNYPSYRAFYTDELRERVARLYADDVRRFGYQFDESAAQLSRAG